LQTAIFGQLAIDEHAEAYVLVQYFHGQTLQLLFISSCTIKFETLITYRDVTISLHKF